MKKIRNADDDEACQDDEHAEPSKPLELLLQEDDAEDPHEDHDGASKHLEGGGRRQGERDVHHRRRGDVAQRRGQQDERGVRTDGFFRFSFRLLRLGFRIL